METTYQIAETIENLKEAHLEIRNLVLSDFATLSEQQKIWKPSPDSWSVTECLAHLNLANTYYIRQIQKKVEDARNSTGTVEGAQFTMSPNGRLMMKVVAPEVKRKVPTPGIMKPVKGLESGPVFSHFIEMEELFLSLLPGTAKLHWEQEKVMSPIASWIRFRLGDVLIFVTAHTRRHINQALRVIGNSGFPV